MNEMELDAVLPAGGRIHGTFAEETGAEVKALIELGGASVIERTVDTLRSTGFVRKVVVIGPDELASHPSVASADAVLHSDPSNSGPTNILRGLDWLREANGGRQADRVLVVTTDLPFLTPGAISGFLYACPADADICVPLVAREEFESAYPGSSNFYVKLRDGEWTIGCAFLVNPAAIERNRDVIERVFEARKSQLRMARLLGLSLILRFLTGRLTVPLIEKRCRQILGCTACPVRGCSPALAFDIDTPEEYRYAAGQRGCRRDI